MALKDFDHKRLHPALVIQVRDQAEASSWRVALTVVDKAEDWVSRTEMTTDQTRALGELLVAIADKLAEEGK